MLCNYRKARDMGKLICFTKYESVNFFGEDCYVLIELNRCSAVDYCKNWVVSSYIVWLMSACWRVIAYIMLNLSDVGCSGFTGPSGFIGPQGFTGTIGQPGSQGRPGDRGEAGPQGQQGSQGIVGATGPTGPLGSPGQPGQDGQMGPRGQPGGRGGAGVQGVRGATGSLIYTHCSNI